MGTEKQKAAARKNIVKAREAQSARAHGKPVPQPSQGLSTAEKDDLKDREFAFPKERKDRGPRRPDVSRRTGADPG